MRVKTGITLILVYLVLALLCAIGWVFNIVHFVHALSGPFDVHQIVRLVGIPIFIIGIILGWFM